MQSPFDSGRDSPTAGPGPELDERLDALVSWVKELELKLSSMALASDERALKELRKTVEALAKRDPKFEERVTNKVDVLADRLQTLATTVSTTAAALAAREGELATLRRELESGRGRAQDVVVESRPAVDPGAIDELRRTVAVLAEQKLPRKVDERMEKLAGAVEVLGQRLDTLGSTVSQTAAGLAGRDGDVASLRRQLEEEQARLEAAVRELMGGAYGEQLVELQRTVSTLGRQLGAVDKESRRVLVCLGVDVEALARRVDALAENATRTNAVLTTGETALTQLREGMSAGAARLESLAERQAQAGEHVAELARRVEALAATVARALATQSQQAVELLAQSDRFEEGEAKVASLVADLQEALRTMPAPSSGPDPELLPRVEELERGQERQLEELTRAREALDGARQGLSDRSDVLAERVEALVAVVEETVSRYEEKESQLRALSERFEEGQSQLRAQSEHFAEKETELRTRSEGFAESESQLRALGERFEEMESQLRALGERFEEGQARVASLVADLQEALRTMPAPHSSTAPDLVERLAGVEGQVQEGLAEAERARDSFAAGLARLDQVVARVDALESKAQAKPEALPLDTGEGRFRVELRHLELRMEHAEEAARENREAVLVQLERLASRMERRLQELEGRHADPEPSPPFVVGGEVVPIRAQAPEV